MKRFLFYRDKNLYLPIEGLTIDRCIVDHALSFDFLIEAGPMTLQIECPFRLMENERVHLLDPSSPRELGPAIGLFGAIVRSARSSEEGQLSVLFDDGREINVDPDPHYEAWGFVGPNGIRAVCLPGGGV